MMEEYITQTNIWKKGFVIGIILLFFDVGISSNVIGNISAYKNIQDYDSKNSDRLSLLPIHKMYIIGRISNLTITKNPYQGYDYSFHCNNIRYFWYWIIDIQSWGYVHAHYHDYWLSLFRWYFKGILKPSFVCGCFYY